MGLYVVANLGAKHGIRTELRHANGGGIVAATWVPGQLLTVSAGPLGRPPLSDQQLEAREQAAMRRGRRRGEGFGSRGGMWWSREAAAANLAARAAPDAQPAAAAPGADGAVQASITERGLPVRVPMAAQSPHLAGPGGPSGPGGAGSPHPADGDGATALQSRGETVEPERDSAVLSALYRGIREADEPDANESRVPAPSTPRDGK
jgi:hypothetical protein